MVRRGRAARIKMHRTYEIGEAADVLGVTPQTVRAWTRQGLAVLTDRRPYLIVGEALKDFLRKRETTRGRPLNLGEFFCFRCKTPTASAVGHADYIALTASSGRLETFCALCEGPCSRVVKWGDLPLWGGILEIGGNVDLHP